MDFSAIAATLRDKGLPLLGAVLGGPVGGGIGAVLASVLGGEPSPENLLAAANDPSTLVRLKEIETTYQIELGKLALDRDRLNYQDTADARSREIETTKATGTRDTNLYVLAWVIIGGFIGCMAAMMVLQYAYGKVLANDPLLTLLLGSLSTDAGMVVGYFFGSSKSSNDKTQLLTGGTKT